MFREELEHIPWEIIELEETPEGIAQNEVN